MSSNVCLKPQPRSPCAALTGLPQAALNLPGLPTHVYGTAVRRRAEPNLRACGPGVCWLPEALGDGLHLLG